MAIKLTALTPEEAEFRAWADGAPTEVLECRVGRHKLPDITSENTRHRLKQGRILLETECERKCGTYLRKYLGVGGVLEGAYTKYEQDSDYRLPPGLTTTPNNRLTKAQLGYIRLVLIDRKEKLDRKRAKAAAAERRAARKTQPA